MDDYSKDIEGGGMGGFDDDDDWPLEAQMDRPIFRGPRGGYGPRPLGPPPLMSRRPFPPSFNRYDNAFGNYQAGYGPGGGFRPPPPFMPPPRPILWGRRPPPPEAPACRYLLRCGVPKESLKNLPRDLLVLIEPQYCGICGSNFASFGISRMHYTSKNHTKNVKKWLSQHSDTYESNREMPLKSRDLYCELCDVQITSKTHAESHYAGKPHRAIVDGRRKPKNPFLFQGGMENRVKQLIRREKKNLKMIDEAESMPIESLKDAKQPPPELYCNICKTSVTCTEQMTMHMNGKRHLAKEKQHIIRFMNGGDENAGNTTSEAAAESNEEAAEGGQENCDWANGAGEKWDEPLETTAN